MDLIPLRLKSKVLKCTYHARSYSLSCFLSYHYRDTLNQDSTCNSTKNKTLSLRTNSYTEATFSPSWTIYKWKTPSTQMIKLNQSRETNSKNLCLFDYRTNRRINLNLKKFHQKTLKICNLKLKDARCSLITEVKFKRLMKNLPT